MTIVDEETVNNYREENTREIRMPDGTCRAVRMTPDLWQSLEFLELWDIMRQEDLAVFALEEMTLQDVTFDRAFRGVLATAANLWAEEGKILFGSSP
jgi:hypothetical protein